MSRLATKREGVRPEIQALRALAVLVVVVFHLWPNRLTGGYVGVDVFFVISGFLITSHLVKELFTTNRIDLARSTPDGSAACCRPPSWCWPRRWSASSSSPRGLI